MAFDSFFFFFFFSANWVQNWKLFKFIQIYLELVLLFLTMYFNHQLIITLSKLKLLRHVWSSISNSHFHISNNIIHIFTHFFTHTYFKKLQTTILKLLYQTPPEHLRFLIGILTKLGLNLNNPKPNWASTIGFKGKTVTISVVSFGSIFFWVVTKMKKISS